MMARLGVMVDTAMFSDARFIQCYSGRRQTNDKRATFSVKNYRTAHY